VLEAGEASVGDVFTVQARTAEREDLVTLSDLAEYSQTNGVVLAARPDCGENPFCLKVLQVGYEVLVSRWNAVPPGQVAATVASGEADLGSQRESDGSITTRRLRILQDDEGLLPASEIVPITPTGQTAAVVDVINTVQGRLTSRDLRSMEIAVREGASPEQAADAWVTSTLLE
jgi:glycine betaine/choline ABC-type transport system substrate-binding protein